MTVTLPLIAAVAWLAGLAALAGGWLAHVEGSAETTAKREFVHAMVALGGGLLLAGVAYALTGPAMERLSPWLLATCFIGGGVITSVVDRWVARRTGPKAQLLALLADYLPETLSLGAVFAHDRRLGLLLAAFIGAQNLPEGFNAFRELKAGGRPPRQALAALAWLSLLGPVAAIVGYLLLHDAPVATAALMALAGGGILYLVFQDIAPKAPMRRHRSPPLGAVIGYALGMLAAQALGR